MTRKCPVRFGGGPTEKARKGPRRRPTRRFVIASGMQVLTSHPLDARKTLVIGVAVMLGTSRAMFPAIYQHVPTALHPFVQSDLSIEIAVALLLTLLFRIGIRRRATTTVPRDGSAPEAVRSFIETHRSAWSGSKTMFDRAGSATAAALTALAASPQTEDPITLKITYDDLDLNVELSYRGPQPEIPADRFGADRAEVVSEDGASRVRLRVGD